MIVLLSGTNGSGKTYIVQNIMEDLDRALGTKVPFGPRGKEGAYIWPELGVCVVGRYNVATGGCDRFSWSGAHDDIERLIVEQAAQGRRVLFEGLLVGSWGVARMKRLLTLGFINIHLTTPLDVCVSSVERRRAEAASQVNARKAIPLNYDNVGNKHEKLISVLRLRRAAGIPVEELSREDALIRTRELILGH